MTGKGAQRNIAQNRRRVSAGAAAQRMDMHIHSVHSDAPTNTIAVIARRCRELDIGVAVCDHNEIRGSTKLASRADVLVLPALEVGSRERLEFIAYFKSPALLEDFFRREIEPYKRSRYFAKLDRSFTLLIPAAKEAGALVCLPHPFAPSYKNVNFGRKRKAALFDPRMFARVDLIEVINGHVTGKRNFKAFVLSETFDKNVTAGSDAHRPDEIGNVYLRFDRALDREGVFALLGHPIKVGMKQPDKPFSLSRFARTAGRAIPMHLQLFFFRKHQRRWMMKYDEEELEVRS